MSLLRASTFFGSMLFLAACTQSPISYGQYTTQGVLGGAGHWAYLAMKTADGVNDCLYGAEGVYEPSCHKFSPGTKGQAIYVDRRGGGSEFDHNFREFLITEMVKLGLTVSEDSSAPLTLSYRVRMVSRNGGKVSRNSVPGKFSAAAGGLGALSLLDNAELAFWQSALLFGGVGLLGDVFNSAASANGEQVVVTVALMKGDAYVMRRAGAFYIDDVDVAQYTGSGYVAEMASPQRKGAKPPKNRKFNVVAQ